MSMKGWIFTGLIGFFLVSCLKEPSCRIPGKYEAEFEMRDIPYVFNNETGGIIPYYTLVNKLSLFVFREQMQDTVLVYDQEYCREHPVIPLEIGSGHHHFLFAANLVTPEELSWSFDNEHLDAVFSIVDNEEPPVLLTAIEGAEVERDFSVPIDLKMLVSRVEIRLDNPPAWISGLNVDIENVAATITTDMQLEGTTHIIQHLAFDNQGAGTYWLGVNAFPTYPDKPAVLTVQFTGNAAPNPLVLDDDRLHLTSGVITRLLISFKPEGNVVTSLQVNGAWEVIDEGKIEI